MVSFSISTYASGYYGHDPMDNPKAAADIIVDPNAVYGYAPNPDSKRLGVYAQYDWSDEAFVAEMRQQREDYHDSLKELYQIEADMKAEGKSIEEIARAVSNRRNEIRLEAYKDDPEGLEKLKESNLATYGNENGGTPDYFYEKYGSWETVIEKAFATNEGADAVLGLYDKYYDTYFIDTPEESSSTEAETTTAEPQNTSETSTEAAETSSTASDSSDGESAAPDTETAATTEATSKSTSVAKNNSATDPTEKPQADSNISNGPVINRSLISPKTGENYNPELWFITGLSVAAIICVIALKKIKNS